MTQNVISITRFAAAVVAAAAISACEAEKSRNPLSPNVAGPIAGVSISPPTRSIPSTAPKSSTLRQCVWSSTTRPRTACARSSMLSSSPPTPRSRTRCSPSPRSPRFRHADQHRGRCRADGRAHVLLARKGRRRRERERLLERGQVRHRRARRDRAAGSRLAGQRPGRLVHAPAADCEQRGGSGPRRTRGLLVRGRAGPGVREDDRRSMASNEAAERRRARRCPSCRQARSSSGGSGDGSMER